MSFSSATINFDEVENGQKLYDSDEEAAQGGHHELLLCEMSDAEVRIQVFWLI